MFLSLIKWNEKWGIHVQWYSIHDVESVKWNPSNRIRQIESVKWNPSNGIRQMTHLTRDDWMQLDVIADQQNIFTNTSTNISRKESK